MKLILQLRSGNIYGQNGKLFKHVTHTKPFRYLTSNKKNIFYMLQYNFEIHVILQKM